MKERALAISIVFSVILNFTACAKNTLTDDPIKEPATTVETVTEIVETPILPEKVIEGEKTLVYSINGCEYLVPESWTEKIIDEYTKFYYPKNGIVMVGFEITEASINNDIDRKSYIHGFSKSFKKFKLISEKEILVDGKKAYRFEMKFLLNGEVSEHSVIAFDYSNGIMSFMNVTEKDSVHAFDEIISSIKLK